ncbi:hypothetical protein AKJ09_02852 [Labilithrix luteola]|uniref:Uncharacterized protein n=1 Tax=Labilithrix luteola TaxID=1391654 RepID=A0A0K1PRN1_9BACT|nr:hypothetical protein AKJ09_02852 [Labilithrix luteola]
MKSRRRAARGRELTRTVAIRQEALKESNDELTALVLGCDATA